MKAEKFEEAVDLTKKVDGGRTVLMYCGATDKGGRKKNEGAYDTVTIEHARGNLHLLAVADGVGYYTTGEVVSKLAVVCRTWGDCE